MYSIDINLLKDRPEYQTAAVKSVSSNSRNQANSYSKTPLFIGLGVGLLALLATGGGWLYLDNQAKELQARQAELDKKLGAAKVQEAKFNEVTAKITQAEQESQSLAGTFNMVRPWSAIIREFRESVPEGVQIRMISQMAVPLPSVTPSATPISKLAAPPSVDGSGNVTKPGATPSTSASPTTSPSPQASGGSPAAGSSQPSAAPAASPVAAVFDAPITRIQIEGNAQSFNDVNSFILTLKQSPFLNPEETQLIDSVLVEMGQTSVSNGQTTTTAKTKSVKYVIQTSLKQVPAAEILRELERKGAIGLVTRLKSLQQQQVIKP
jgi:type IV pilus assembly protein PilN